VSVVRKTVFSIKCVTILAACNSGFLFIELHFHTRNYYLPPNYPQIPSVVLANYEQIVHLNSTNLSKRGRTPLCRGLKCTPVSAPHVYCACISVQPSAEVNFTLRRQFYVTVSTIVTLVVFGGLFSNNLGACLGKFHPGEVLGSPFP
jgi:hypothetical protein